MIYFSREGQQQIHMGFFDALRDGGYLITGTKLSPSQFTRNRLTYGVGETCDVVWRCVCGGFVPRSSRVDVCVCLHHGMPCAGDGFGPGGSRASGFPSPPRLRNVPAGG